MHEGSPVIYGMSHYEAFVADGCGVRPLPDREEIARGLAGPVRPLQVAGPLSEQLPGVRDLNSSVVVRKGFP